MSGASRSNLYYLSDVPLTRSQGGYEEKIVQTLSGTITLVPHY